VAEFESELFDGVFELLNFGFIGFDFGGRSMEACCLVLKSLGFVFESFVAEFAFELEPFVEVFEHDHVFVVDDGGFGVIVFVFDDSFGVFDEFAEVG